MKIAIIGSGIAGNYAAYQLNKSHDVTLFEANDYIGGHTHTHDIEWAGGNYAIDSGFIVFNERTYPNFIAILDELGVPYSDTRMSFSVKNDATGLEYNGSSLNALFAQRRNLLNPGFLAMIREILRFNRNARKALVDNLTDLSLGEFLAQGDYSKDFIDQYIVPMGAAIWSTSPQLMRKFPARFFIRFFDHHGLLTVTDHPQWHVIDGGSREYVRKLTAGFKDKIRLNSPVMSVQRFESYVELTVHGADPQRFDRVFIATHSDQALRILTDASALEREVLGAIAYQRNEAVIHTDDSVLPTARRAWGAWNYHIGKQQQDRVALTYHMNCLQNLDAPVQFCVTLNNHDVIDETRILKRISYDHPLYTPASIAAQQRQAELNGVSGTYFCGAYWGNGFHEDGVVSAINALKHFAAG